MDLPSNHPEQLWTSAHDWHLTGLTPSAVHLDCCACGYSAIIDTTEAGGSWLRYTVMDGGDVIGKGRGLLLGNCSSGSGRLSIDGYRQGSCAFVHDDGDEFMRRCGRRGMGLVQLPSKE